jgi:hypothetical protein
MNWRPLLKDDGGELDWLAIAGARPLSIGPFCVAHFFPLFESAAPFGAMLLFDTYSNCSVNRYGFPPGFFPHPQLIV